MDKIYYKKRIKKAINMKEKLTSEHLAAYLPYGLKYKAFGETYRMHELHNNPEIGINGLDLSHINPLLHPLSKLTQEIEHNGEKFVPIEKLADISIEKFPKTWRDKAIEDIKYWIKNGITKLPYNLVILLISWHFDLFGLIEKGLAIEKQ